MVATIPKAFLTRRLHSLFGVFFAVFLFEHLLVNSQATLFPGNDGEGFIRSVNGIQEIPYLLVIELAFLWVPITLHAYWGIGYLLDYASNSRVSDGTTPSLPEYGRNRAYTWQRITSWILLVGLFLHIVDMRFYHYPTAEGHGKEKTFSVSLNEDEGLKTLASRLNVTLKKNPGEGVVAVASDFGTAELLTVREAFKSWWMMALYAAFVLSACFHAYNGLWTALITWGITLTERSRQMSLRFCTMLGALVAFFGLSAILAYWVNLRF